MRTRGFVARSDAHTWRSFGWLTGMLLVRSLEREQKVISLRLVVNDLPGTLGRVATCLGACGANILEVSHRRMFLDVPAKGTTLDLTIEVKDAGHGRTVVAALEKGGFAVAHIDAPATNGSTGV